MVPAGNIPLVLSAATFLLVLSGCTPHPAAGNWTAATDSDSAFNRLEVTYEGRANLFEAGEEKAGRHCFWSGERQQVISLSCKPAFDTDIEEHYRLTIGDDDTATLTRDGKALVVFSRQPD